MPISSKNIRQRREKRHYIF